MSLRFLIHVCQFLASSGFKSSSINLPSFLFSSLDSLAFLNAVPYFFWFAGSDIIKKNPQFQASYLFIYLFIYLFYFEHKDDEKRMERLCYGEVN